MTLPVHRRNARRSDKDLSFALALLVSGLLAGFAGCAPYDAAPWRKEGASDQTSQRDSAECRETARESALRRYPYRGGSPSLGPAGAVMSQQRDDTDRAVAEASQFNECMQGKGYRRASATAN